MENMETSVVTNASEGERSVYAPPRLLYYGKIHQLTATGSGANVENKGLDDNNNMKRKP